MININIYKKLVLTIICSTVVFVMSLSVDDYNSVYWHIAEITVISRLIAVMALIALSMAITLLLVLLNNNGKRKSDTT